MKKPKYPLMTQKEQQQQKIKDQLQRVQNKKQNLCNQTAKIYRQNKGNSKESRATYEGKMSKFNEFLAEKYSLEKFKNVAQKHVTEYVIFRISQGWAGSTITNDLSAIQWTHSRSGSKNKIEATRNIKSNLNIPVPAKTTGTVDRAWMKDEFELAKNIALDMDREDCCQALKMARTFGMRIDEACHATVKEFKDALSNGEISITGKGNYTRVLLRLKKHQLVVAHEVLEYARKEGRFNPSDKIISRTGLRGVEKEKAAVQNWMNNHRGKWEADFRIKYSEEYEKQKAYCALSGLKLNTHKISFHGLRYNFAQERYEEQYKHYILLGWNDDRASNQARLDVSEDLGHHRDAVTNIYLSGSKL